jgi:hypothetical protein
MGNINVPDHGFDKDKNVVQMPDGTDWTAKIRQLETKIQNLNSEIATVKNAALPDGICPIPVGGIFVTIDMQNPSKFWNGTSWALITGNGLKHKDGSADYDPTGAKYVMFYNDQVGDYSKTNIIAGGVSQITLSKDQLPEHKHFLINPLSSVPSGAQTSDLPTDKKIYSDWQSDVPTADGKHYIFQPHWGVPSGSNPAYSGEMWLHDGAGTVSEGGAFQTDKVGSGNPIDIRPGGIVLAFWRRTR